MTVIFKSGSDIPIADTLSRLHPDDGEEKFSFEADIELAVHSSIAALLVSDQKMDDIRRETASNDVMLGLQRFINTGWSQLRRQCPPSMFSFWNHQDELSFCSGVILKGKRIIIPASL